MGEKTSGRTWSIDCLKFICAFLVVCIHTPFPTIFGRYMTAIARIAVPLFFMITGYFYQQTVDRGNVKKQIIKILKLAVATAILYFVISGVFALINGTFTEYVNSCFSLKALGNWILLNDSPFKSHLWYLNALLYVLVIVAIADKIGNRQKLYWIIPILLVGDLVLGRYSLLIFGKVFPYIWVRNFLFVGLPYFLLGDLIRVKTKQKPLKSNFKWMGILLMVFAVTTFMEMMVFSKLFVAMKAKNIIDKTLVISDVREHYLSTTLMAVVIFILTLKLVNKSQHKLLNLPCTIGRKYSLMIYIIHPFFITCGSTLINFLVAHGMPQMIGKAYSVVAPVVIFIVSYLFAVIWYKIKGSIIKEREA